ncbi:MAG: NrtA/SsuA/CpmA family ABC transporter substrate-binding protein [Thermodesulfobacteriota bacterium]
MRRTEERSPDRLFSLRLVFAVLILLAGCDRGPALPGAGGGKKITVALTPWLASVPIYLAQEKGYFRDEGLDVALRPFESGHLGLAAVLSGGADFATAGETPIARAAVDGKPVMVVATLAEVDDAILIIARRDRGIRVACDLRGKTVGRVAGTTAHFFLDIYLTTDHIDPKDVRIVDLPADRVVRSLMNGEVDAVSTWAPHTTTLQDMLGANAVVLYEPGLYTMTWNLIAARELAQRDPDVVARFLRAILRAERLVAERPAEARAAAVRAFGSAGVSVEREWSRCRFVTRLDQSLLLYLEDQARWMIRKEAGRRKAPNFRNHVFTKPLKTVSPEAVLIVGE